VPIKLTTTVRVGGGEGKINRKENKKKNPKETSEQVKP